VKENETTADRSAGLRDPTSAASPPRPRRPAPEGIRPTKVGFWFILLAVVVGVAASNTGNNALYIVLAAMLGILVVSGVTSRLNLRGLQPQLSAPGELFARRPSHLRLSVLNGSRFLPRWLLVSTLGRGQTPLLVPFLPAGSISTGFLEVILPRRGRQRFSWVHVATIFPLGLFHKGMRYPVELEVLVYPEIFPAERVARPQSGYLGEGVRRRTGWGHDLHSLRAFRQGDDPRRIHWKQTARTGELVFTERQSEDGRRLSIVLDNAVGPLESQAEQERFESLVSEAATTAVHHLAQGFEVELVARDLHLPAAGGRRQRALVLEALALLEAVPRRAEPILLENLAGSPLRLGMDTVAGEGAA
jgi:uncharacterized protein (DUF58 family)